MTDAEEVRMQKWVDKATYEQLLSKWRGAPVGSPWFQGKMGDYYRTAMKASRETTSQEDQVSASKLIGWD